MHPLDVADPAFFMGAEVAAAEDHQIVAVMRGRRQPGGIEEGADAAEIEGGTIKSVAEEGALDPLAFVGALPDNRQGAGEAAGDGQGPHPSEQLHRFHVRLGKEDIGWRLNWHADLHEGCLAMINANSFSRATRTPGYHR